jgi:biotin carboxylase
VPRVLLILPTATYRAPDFLAAARKAGIDVIIGSELPQTVAPSVLVDLDDPETGADAIVAAHADAPLDAVVGVDDQGVVVAALAAARLGLPHNPPEAASATRDKSMMRRRLAAAGVDQPDFALAAPDSLVSAVDAVGLPCVIKPLSLAASRGVIRADDLAAAEAAARRTRAIVAAAGQDPDMPLLVERFVPGVEVAVEGLLSAGQLEVLAVFDKPDPLDGPFFEETIYLTPSGLAPEVQDEVAARVSEAALALGLITGPVHAEVRIDAGRVVLIELASRSIGGHCSRVLRFGTGISLEEVILRHAVGQPVAGIARGSDAAGVMMLPIPTAGVLCSVAGQEAARRVPGVDGLEISIPIGRTVRPLPEGDRYLGFLFARGHTPEEVDASLRSAYACLEVEIAPS